MSLGLLLALTDVHNDENDCLRWGLIPLNYHSTQSVGVSTDLSDWNGYSNSRKIHEFVQNNSEDYAMIHFPAALACETYGNRTIDLNGNPPTAYDWQKPLAAPDNTSGWFLPTYGQLQHLHANASLLSARMTDVKDNTPADCDYKDKIHWFTPSVYWSSTESSSNAAGRTFNVYFGSIGIGSQGFKTNFYYARAILAF